MKIAIDARELEGSRTGAGRVLMELLKRLDPAFLSHHRVYLYFKNEIPDLKGVSQTSFQMILLAAPACIRKDFFWEQFLLPQRLRQDKIDLFWGANGACPVLRPKHMRAWVTMYDLTYFMSPHWYNPKERAMRQVRSRIAAASADTILTSSEASKSDIGRWLKKNGNQIRVLHLGSYLLPEKNLNKDRISNARLLYVGSILNRRPVEDLIKTVSLLVKRFPDCQLRIIGDNRTYPKKDLRKKARELGIEESVQISGYVSEAELKEAYQNASIFCFPSFYEGFGLPLVEAQSQGIPVITMRNSSLSEIGADTVCYTSKPGPDGWVSVITDLLLKRDLYQEMGRRGYENAARYTWDRFTREWQSLVQSDTIRA